MDESLGITNLLGEVCCHFPYHVRLRGVGNSLGAPADSGRVTGLTGCPFSGRREIARFGNDFGEPVSGELLFRP
jgi:hypothetical protein